jgi:hypothetical protein
LNSWIKIGAIKGIFMMFRLIWKKFLRRKLIRFQLYMLFFFHRNLHHRKPILYEKLNNWCFCLSVLQNSLKKKIWDQLCINQPGKIIFSIWCTYSKIFLALNNVFFKFLTYNYEFYVVCSNIKKSFSFSG